jgi:RNA polymerase sigma factor (sigma-70 family)
MRGPSSGAFIQQLERLFQHGTTVGLTEGELLERFVGGNDESALEVLIARHGPMVLGVCRQLLRDPNDVDDAFQATFLVLVRKAGTLHRRDLLGNWLYGVAYRVATRARVLAARRSARTPFGIDAIDRLDPASGFGNGDSVPGLDPEPIPWLHEEVRRLPEKYRVPVLICYFEGLTHEQASARLGWPIGTVKGRLARARDLLRKRLNRRGVTLSDPVLAARLALPAVRATVPDWLQYATIRAARAIARPAGGSILSASSISLSVATLTDGVLRAMIATHAKAIFLALLVAGVVTTSLVVASVQEPDRPDQPPAANAKAVERIDLISREDTEPTPDLALMQPPAAQKKAVAAKKAAPATDEPAQPGVGGGMMGGGMGGRMGGGMGDMGGMGGGMAGMGMGGMGGGGMGGIGMGGMGRTAFLAQREFQNRVEIVQLSAALAASDKATKNQAVMTKLDQPLAMSFANPTPLEDVLKYIKSATMESKGKPIPIYVDPKGLQQVDATMSSSVTIDLDGVPLKMSLRLMLKQLGLAYCVRDGVLIISSVQGIREELAEAACEQFGNDPAHLDDIMESMGIQTKRGPGSGIQ